VVSAEDWTRFRGPNGSGVSPSAGFPVEFGKDKNVVWRIAVRSGKSSPVLTRDSVLLTAHENDSLYTQCFDRATGKLRWEQPVERTGREFANALNHPAAISPVTDGENVYAFFKDFGLVSYDGAGKLRWKVPLGPFVTTMGLGASPILAGNNVILLADQLEENSFVAAFDRRNGELRWKTARTESEGWGSPLFYQPRGAAPVVLTASRGQFSIYTAGNGKRIGGLESIATTIVASPILDKDTVYVFGYGSETPAPFSRTQERFDKNKDGRITPDEYGNDAFVRGIGKFVGNRDGIVTREEWDEKQKVVLGPNRLMAIRLERDAQGAVSARELWHHDRNFSTVIPSPLLYQGVLYVIRNGGILTTFDAETGKLLKTDRLTGALGGYSASPVAADGKIFLAGEDGHIAVVRPGPEWELLAVNEIGESLYATPALSEGQIYVRSSEALYRFESARASR